MDFLAYIMSLRAQGMTAAQITEAVNEYLQDHPDALDQAAVEAILDGRLDVIDDELDSVKSALNVLDAEVNGGTVQKTEEVSVPLTSGKALTANSNEGNYGKTYDAYGWQVSGFISCEKYTAIDITMPKRVAATDFGIVFYSDNIVGNIPSNCVVGYVCNYGASGSSVREVRHFAIPEGAKYFRTVYLTALNDYSCIGYWESQSGGLIGDLSDLETEEKSSIVEAINEVNTNTGNALSAINENYLSMKYMLDTECEFKYLANGEWGEELVSYRGKAYRTQNAIGMQVDDVNIANITTLRNYKLDVSNYKKIAFPVYKSSESLGDLFVDENNIVCGVFTNATLESGTFAVVDVPENSKFLYISINVNWSSEICYCIGAINVLDNTGGSSIIIVHDDSYPSLTSSEKNEIVELCEDYYTIKSKFAYGGYYRNQYAGQSCISSGKFHINCGNFAQFIWMGRSASDFDPNNYTPYINKAFNWGYYFNFLVHRKCYGIYKNQSAQDASQKYYGYQHPTGSNAYSFNTFDNGNGMQFRPFMAAADLAYELFNMGCEVPRRAVEVGDLIFYRGPEFSGMTNETQLNFRNISHVGVVIDANYNGLGILRMMESTFYDPNGDISIISLDETDTNNRLRAGMYDNRIVMCARHPHAFGIPTNVPNAITEI